MTGFTNQGGLSLCWNIAGAEKKRAQSGENNTFEEGGKRKQKNYFSESTQNRKVKLMIKNFHKSRTIAMSVKENLGVMFLKLIFIYL